MNSYLLDTHTAIWYFEGNLAMPKNIISIISDDSISKYISIASAWEVAIKTNIGKLKFDGGVKKFLQLADKNQINILPIINEHLAAYESLPFIHRDPFDRLFVATAIAENMTLITDDKNIALYEVTQIW